MKKLKIIYMLLEAVIMIAAIAIAVVRQLNGASELEFILTIGAGILISMALSICLVIIPTIKKNR